MYTEAFEALTSQREKQVAQLAVQGLRPCEIGDKLSLSEKAVEEDLKEIFDRLGVSSRVELIFYALTYGLPS